MHPATTRLAPLIAAGLLAACSGDPAAESTTSGAEAEAPIAGGPAAAATNTVATNDAPPAPPVAADQADYLGRWIGVEGTMMTVTAKPGGGVRIDNRWTLDDRATFDGSVTAEGLRFTRKGVAETAVRTDGDATGLKWLAGKTDCLTVRTGEGYCRS